MKKIEVPQEGLDISKIEFDLYYKIDNKNKTYNKSKTVSKTIKSVNKYSKLIPKKSNNKLATKISHEIYKGFSFIIVV